MLRRSTVALWGALAVLGCSGTDAAADKRERAARAPAREKRADPRPQKKDAGVERIDGLLAKHVEPLVHGDSAIVFVSVGVFSNGREHYASFVGAGGSYRPSADSKFHVASLTKSHTALLAASLSVDEKLDIDRPVAKCKRKRVAAFCASPQTTLRHLLTHSAGLEGAPRDLRGDAEYDLDNLRRYLSETKPRAQPGAGFRYSTMGYGAVALVLEQRTGKKLESLLRKRVLEPIGSSAMMDEQEGTDVAPGFRGGQPAQASPTRKAFAASGGLLASARDLLQLVAVNVEPARVPALRRAVELTHEVNWDLYGFRGAAVALGWQVDRERGYFWHPGVSSVHRTAMAFDPENGAGVVILAGQSMALSDYRLEDAAFALLEGLAGKSKKRGAGN